MCNISSMKFTIYTHKKLVMWYLYVHNVQALSAEFFFCNISTEHQSCKDLQSVWTKLNCFFFWNPMQISRDHEIVSLNVKRYQSDLQNRKVVFLFSSFTYKSVFSSSFLFDSNLRRNNINSDLATNLSFQNKNKVFTFKKNLHFPLLFPNWIQGWKTNCFVFATQIDFAFIFYHFILIYSFSGEIFFYFSWTNWKSYTKSVTTLIVFRVVLIS